MIAVLSHFDRSPLHLGRVDATGKEHTMRPLQQRMIADMTVRGPVVLYK